jgi:hypothetical protein
LIFKGLTDTGISVFDGVQNIDPFFLFFGDFLLKLIDFLSPKIQNGLKSELEPLPCDGRFSSESFSLESVTCGFLSLTVLHSRERRIKNPVWKNLL